uniref:Uncharacterized protein n=1 Tax=Podoviridae sp. ct8Lf7 TaxID=2827723 RepID=A0A8S5S0M9_9CAUD|nr:MAG TPA: hypothetical protein [Podoviridae sp. ct8Lf7]
MYKSDHTGCSRIFTFPLLFGIHLNPSILS